MANGLLLVYGVYIHTRYLHPKGIHIMNTPRTPNSIRVVRLRDMTGEAEIQDGYVGVYEVILNPDTDTEEVFGTLDKAAAGGKHKLQSWDGEHVWYYGYRGNPRRRIARWIERNIPATTCKI